MRFTQLAALALLLVAGAAAGQSPPGPVPIRDNSFLLEEAYNQEERVVQHISTLIYDHDSGAWAYSFTQEWPMGGLRHQLSFTVPVMRAERSSPVRLGDVGLNYRYQLMAEESGVLAVAPRLSVFFPSGSVSAGTGRGGVQVQADVPLSVELSSRLAAHTNVGATLTPRARAGDGTRATLRDVNLGQSLIWLALPTFNVMLEGVWTSTESVGNNGVRARTSGAILSPGVRGAINFRSGLQIVPGFAVPVTLTGHTHASTLFYLSFEHPF